VYKDYAIVNYDPLDQTVLANEQVIDGRAERSGALVESRFMEQYFITAGRFAEALDNELQSDQLIWPSHIKKIQRNWIEKVNGGFIEGQLVIDGKMERLRVFVEDSIKSLQEGGLVAVVGAQNMSILNRLD
jgi:leucyl-tRNA synthetase